MATILTYFQAKAANCLPSPSAAMASVILVATSDDLVVVLQVGCNGRIVLEILNGRFENHRFFLILELLLSCLLPGLDRLLDQQQ